MSASGRGPAASFLETRPILYYITDRRQLHGSALLSTVRRAIAWGVDCVQVREKDLSDLELYRLVLRVVALADGSPCRILVNGRADVALAAGASGVHLPAGGLRPPDLRRWLPRGMIVGVSTHSLAEAQEAERGGADYVLFGPVFRTPSKVRYGPPLGLEALREAARTLAIPVIALGGIRRERIGPTLAAGAAGAAGITLFQRELKQMGRSRLQLLEAIGRRGSATGASSPVSLPNRVRGRTRPPPARRS